MSQGERADRVDPAVGRYIREVFASDDVLSMLRTVQAIVRLLERFPPERASAACERASYFGNFTYPGVRDILRKALDREPLPSGLLAPVGQLTAPRYARPPRGIGQLPLELPYESN